MTINSVGTVIAIVVLVLVIVLAIIGKLAILPALLFGLLALARIL